MEVQKYYKIRHKKTGRWSKGGVYVTADGHGGQWADKGGKTWDTLGKLRAHITSHMNRYNNTDMTDWEVVEYHMVYQDAKPIHQMIDPKKLIDLLKK
jgi:hypothetical protein